MIRRTVLSGFIASVVALFAFTPAAHADSAYRYWGYFTSTDGTWTFAMKGPADLVPADGSVEGWRFAVTTDAMASPPAPSAAADFATLCKGIAEQTGKKRVAVVIDAGPAAIAPSGETPPAPVSSCAVVDAGASGLQVLESAAKIRVDKGLVCGIGGYPATECAPSVDIALAALSVLTASAPTSSMPDESKAAESPAASSPRPEGSSSAMSTSTPSSSSGTVWITLLVVALVIVVIGFLIARSRRRA